MDRVLAHKRQWSHCAVTSGWTRRTPDQQERKRASSRHECKGESHSGYRRSQRQHRRMAVPCSMPFTVALLQPSPARASWQRPKQAFGGFPSPPRTCQGQRIEMRHYRPGSAGNLAKRGLSCRQSPSQAEQCRAAAPPPPRRDLRLASESPLLSPAAAAAAAGAALVEPRPAEPAGVRAGRGAPS